MVLGNGSKGILMSNKIFVLTFSNLASIKEVLIGPVILRKRITTPSRLSSEKQLLIQYAISWTL